MFKFVYLNEAFSIQNNKFASKEASIVFLWDSAYDKMSILERVNSISYKVFEKNFYQKRINNIYFFT